MPICYENDTKGARLYLVGADKEWGSKVTDVTTPVHLPKTGHLPMTRISFLRQVLGIPLPLSSHPRTHVAVCLVFVPATPDCRCCPARRGGGACRRLKPIARSSTRFARRWHDYARLPGVGVAVLVCRRQGPAGRVCSGSLPACRRGRAGEGGAEGYQGALAAADAAEPHSGHRQRTGGPGLRAEYQYAGAPEAGGLQRLRTMSLPCGCWCGPIRVSSRSRTCAARPW